MKRKASTKAAGRPKGKAPVPKHPHGVATLGVEEVDDAPDQPFAEGIADELDPDLRHRLVSEAAFHHQVERGYNSDYDDDDWRDAESEVDHLNLNPSPEDKPDRER